MSHTKKVLYSVLLIWKYVFFFAPNINLTESYCCFKSGSHIQSTIRILILSLCMLAR